MHDAEWMFLVKVVSGVLHILLPAVGGTGTCWRRWRRGEEERGG